MSSLLAAIEELESGSIIQVDPDFAKSSFGGCFVVVQEINERGIYATLFSWGVMVDGPVTVRVPFDRYRRTGGRVQWPLS